jgi:tetratricopeptide (TPR) repeat protein
MRRRLALPLALLAVALVGATPGPADPSALLDEADAAFARGDYARAEELYGRAELRSPDPGRVTLALAAAKYRLALAEPGRSAALLAEADGLFKSCLDPAEPRRAEALLGLGNCLLREAAGRDARAAWSAAEIYAKAERCPGAAALGDTPRHNLQRARLLARQIPTAVPEKPDKQPPDDDPERNPKPPDRPPEPRDAAEPGDGKKGTSGYAKVNSGQTPNPTDDQRSSGEGELPPIPEGDDQRRLTAREAREYLEQATRRIMEEGRHHRRDAPRPSAPGVPDW